MTAESRGCDKCGRPFGVGLDLTQIANASLYELDRLRAENAALRRLADAVRGFRAHGEAKNGTHGTLMFKALDELDSQ